MPLKLTVTRDGLESTATAGELDLIEAVSKAFEMAATAIHADK